MSGNEKKFVKPFDDDLSDFLGDLGVAPEAKPLPEKAKVYVETIQHDFSEGCRACGGTGFWRGVRRCFKCKGKGTLTFKTSPQKRADARVYAAKAKARTAEANWDDFVAAHPEVAAWMDRSTKFEFAVSLRNAVLKYGALTDPQLAAAYRCVEKFNAAVARNQERKANAPTVQTNKLVEAFAKANAKAARPGQVGIWMKPLAMKASNDVALTFSNGTNQWAGMIFVKNANRDKLGHIKDGKFVRKFACTDAEENAVVDCCNDPEKAAIAYGKAFGVCAICHRTLTNDGSIERGIGPICADKFGW